MRRVRVLLSLSLFGLLATTNAFAQTDKPAAAKSPGVAVVELFTSQGCSSCPPADELLRKIQVSAESRGFAVHVLSFHVDYWNRLGWKDPYSSSAATRRQRGYAAAADSKRIYTPQMIVNGTTEFVGSSGSKAHAAISKSLAQQTRVTLNLDLDRPTTGGVDVSYQVAGDFTDHVLNLAAVQTPAANAVSRGENSGRELSHVNIVRGFKTIRLENAAGKISINLPAETSTSTIRVIAYVQDPQTKAITGAATAN